MTYFIGLVVLIVALGLAAFMVGVPSIWIAIGAVAFLSLVVLSGISRAKRPDPP